jgi:hypothetical protein
LGRTRAGAWWGWRGTRGAARSKARRVGGDAEHRRKNKICFDNQKIQNLEKIKKHLEKLKEWRVAPCLGQGAHMV